MNEVIIEFGSNIEPDINVLKAKDLISDKYTIVKESRFIRTKPVGNPNQPDYINGAVLVKTTESKEEFDSFLKDVERKLGRKKSDEKYAPRIIDLDIIAWNNKVIHNDFYERDFVRENVFEVSENLEY